MSLLGRLFGVGERVAPEAPPQVEEPPRKRLLASPSVLLPPEVKKVLDEEVPDLLSLRVVLFFVRNPNTLDRLEGLARRLSVHARELRPVVEALMERNILRAEYGLSVGSSDHPLLSFVPHPEVRARMKRLADYYSHPSGRQIIDRYLADRAACQSLRKTLEASPHVSPLNLRISCDNGHLVVEGQVNLRQEFDELARWAQRIAQGPLGIEELTLDVVVSPAESPFDGALCSKVREALKKASLPVASEEVPISDLDPSSGIGVEVLGRIVYLHGYVASPQQRSLALQVARGVEGVLDVVSFLQTAS